MGRRVPPHPSAVLHPAPGGSPDEVPARSRGRRRTGSNSGTRAQRPRCRVRSGQRRHLVGSPRRRTGRGRPVALGGVGCGARRTAGRPHGGHQPQRDGGGVQPDLRRRILHRHRPLQHASLRSGIDGCWDVDRPAGERRRARRRRGLGPLHRLRSGQRHTRRPRRRRRRHHPLDGRRRRRRRVARRIPRHDPGHG